MPRKMIRPFSFEATESEPKPGNLPLKFYVPEELEFDGRTIIYQLKKITDKDYPFITVAGYKTSEVYTNDRGLNTIDVEFINDEKKEEEIRKQLSEKHNVELVNFWTSRK